jgi:8-oxo-dGTP pyrophosphatase MutT (NUDIX family)
MSEHWSGGIYMLNDVDGRRCVLLVKEHQKGLWSLPGGKQEANETPEETFIREVWEETGCNARPGKLLKKIEESNHIRYVYSIELLTGTPNPQNQFQAFPLLSLPVKMRIRHNHLIHSVFKGYYRNQKRKRSKNRRKAELQPLSIAA